MKDTVSYSSKNALIAIVVTVVLYFVCLIALIQVSI